LTESSKINIDLTSSVNFSASNVATFGESKMEPIKVDYVTEAKIGTAPKKPESRCLFVGKIKTTTFSDSSTTKELINRMRTYDFSEFTMPENHLPEMDNLVDFLLQKGLLFKVDDKLYHASNIRGLCSAITKNASSGEALKSFLQYLRFRLSLWDDKFLGKNFYFQNSNLKYEIGSHWIFLNKLASNERLRTELPSSIKYIKDELGKNKFDRNQLLAKISRNMALTAEDGRRALTQ
jgi:hypothetical protein